MSVRPPYLFQLEDGDSLSLAVHSEVPQYDRICEIIVANQGSLVEEASAADFCIVSVITPDAEGIAEALHSEGKLAIQDHWIRDSVDAGQLLPWYSYQVGTSSFVSKINGKDAFPTFAPETEERDIHELVATSARYLPLFPEEELCHYVSKKCPHRSATSFRNLYTLHQSEIDSRVLYLRGKLESAFAFDNTFSRRPRMSFGSPNKIPLLSIKASSSISPSVARTSNMHVLGEEMDITPPEQVAEPSRRFGPNNPEETPIIDGNPRQSPVNTTAPYTVTAPTGSHVQVGSDNLEEAIAFQLLPVTSQSTVPAPPPGSVEIRMGPISLEEFRALARFLADYPLARHMPGFTAHMERFREMNPLGRQRSPRAWREAYDRHTDKIKDLIKVALRKPPAGTAKPVRVVLPTAIVAKRVSPTRLTGKPRPGVTTSEKDKQALAKWLLDNPRGPPTENEAYFERFIAHHKHLPSRSWNAWRNAAKNHKEDIMARQRAIQHARRRNARKGSSSISSNSELSSAENSMEV